MWVLEARCQYSSQRRGAYARGSENVDAILVISLTGTYRSLLCTDHVATASYLYDVDAATTPSCCIRAKLSQMPRCSMTFPAAKWKNTAPATLVDFPVGAMPRRSP